MEDKNTTEEPEPLTLRELLGSVLAAAIGVQSDRNRERDFRRGSARLYVVMGVVATVAFVGVVYLVVKLVLSFAAA